MDTAKRVEVDPENPYITKKVLIPSPFTLYPTLDDRQPKKYDQVPAVFHIRQETQNGKLLQLADVRGKPIGWIEKSEVPAYHWNTRCVLTQTGKVSLYKTADDAQKGSTLVELPAAAERTTFPVLERKGDAFLVGPPLSRTFDAKGLQFPLWIEERTKDGHEAAERGYAVTLRELEGFQSTVKFIRTQLETRKNEARQPDDIRNLLYAAHSATPM